MMLDKHAAWFDSMKFDLEDIDTYTMIEELREMIKENPDKDLEPIFKQIQKHLWDANEAIDEAIDNMSSLLEGHTYGD